MDADCWTCRSVAGTDRISPGPPIYEGTYWLVEHAYPCALKGWLVLVLKRHAAALHELTPAEFAELGEVQGRVAEALFAALDCEKEYLFGLAEAAHFHHVHIHIVPKPRDLPDEYKATKIFALLHSPDPLPPAEVAAFCEELHTRFFAS